MIFSDLKTKINEDICLYARPDNHPWSYLFDCGQASLLTPGDCLKLKAFFITHTHIDHFMNFMGVFRHLLGAQNTIVICGPSEIQKNVQGALHGITWNLITNEKLVLEIREILETEVRRYRLIPPKWELEPLENLPSDSEYLYEAGEIFVKYALLDHRIHSVAYLIEEKERVNIQKEKLSFKPGSWIREVKEAFLQNQPEKEILIEEKEVKAKEFFPLITRSRGYSLGYVMDHLASSENHEKLSKLYQGIDELYIESFYRYVDLAYAKKNFHSTAQQSGELARKTGVKKLNLVHHSRRYAKEYKDLLEEGYAAFEGRKPSFEQLPQARFGLEENSFEE